VVFILTSFFISFELKVFILLNECGVLIYVFLNKTNVKICFFFYF